MAYLLGVILYCVIFCILVLIHAGVALGWLIAGLVARFEGIGAFGVAPIADVFPRLLRYFREGEPLIPEGLRHSMIFGYWFGIVCVYLGHLGIAVFVFFLIELRGTPYTESLPLAIGLLPVLAAYGIGIAMVESSYRLWAEQIAEPFERYQRKQREKPMPGSGEPESPAAQALTWVVPMAGALLVLGFQILFEKRVESQRARENDTARTLIEAGPAMSFIEKHWEEHGELLCPGDPEMELMPIPRVKAGQRWVELTGCGELYVRFFNRDGFVYRKTILQAIDAGESELGWGCVSPTLREMSRESGQRCRFDAGAIPGRAYVTEATLARYEEELGYVPSVGMVTYGESRTRVLPGDFLPLGGDGWQGTLGYFDYDSGRWLETQAALSVKLSDNGRVSMDYVYPDEPERNDEHTLRVERNGTYLNGLEVIDRSVKPDTILRIIAAGNGTDEDRSVPVRMTYLISKTKLTITKEIVQPTGTRFKRHEYHFERAGVAAN